MKITKLLVCPVLWNKPTFSEALGENYLIYGWTFVIEMIVKKAYLSISDLL